MYPSGFWAEYCCYVGQWETHFDPLPHFVKGSRTIDRIDLKKMIMPLVVIDVHQKVAKNPAYTIIRDDIRAWERKQTRKIDRVFRREFVPFSLNTRYELQFS